MFNKKGFISLELIQYIIITLLLAIFLNFIISLNINFKTNDELKLYQSYDMLRKTLIKYQSISEFNKNLIVFDDQVKIKIQDNQIYETPGYMPYFQDISNASFIFQNNILSLKFTYNKVEYQQVIFYDKK